MAMQRGFWASAARRARASGVAFGPPADGCRRWRRLAEGLGECGRFGDFERTVHLVGAVADADGEDGADIGGVGAGEDAGEVAGGDHVEVGVGVDEHRFKVQGSRFKGPARGGVVKGRIAGMKNMSRRGLCIALLALAGVFGAIAVTVEAQVHASEFLAPQSQQPARPDGPGQRCAGSGDCCGGRGHAGRGAGDSVRHDAGADECEWR